MSKIGDGLKTLIDLQAKLEALHYQLMASSFDPKDKIIDGRRLRIEDYGFMVPVLLLQEGQSFKDAMPDVAQRAAWDVRIVDAIRTVTAVVRDLQKAQSVKRGDVPGL